MVIVKTLEMPKSCLECPFNQGEYGPEYYEKQRCILTGHGMIKKYYKNRPEHCPLVDLGVVLSQMEKKRNRDKSNYLYV